MPIRILLACMPQMLVDILTAVLESEAGMQCIGGAAAADLDASMAREQPDVVLIGPDHGELPISWQEVLRRHPPVKVFVIEAYGRNAFLYEFRPTRTHLGEASPARLTGWIRVAVQPMRLLLHNAEDGCGEEHGENAAATPADLLFRWRPDRGV